LLQTLIRLNTEELLFNSVDRLTVLRFTVTGALLAARGIHILPMNQHA
jgi:hypothetical protein